jgi:hypothetical protein
MSRYRAALIHLLISAVLVGNVIGLVIWVWYPEPSFEAVGTISIIGLLVGVDLVMGPLLTLIVFKHGKPGLMFDLSVIALMQIVALIYGSYTLYEEKPNYLVFAIDRLEFVSKKQVDQSAIQYDELRNKHFAELIQVFARSPEDPDEFQRYFDSVVFDGKPDLESRAEYWEPWTAGADVIRSQLKSIEDIRPASPLERENLQQAIDDYAEDHPNLGILPIGGIEKDLGMLLDGDTLEILGILDADPWLPNETEVSPDEPK